MRLFSLCDEAAFAPPPTTCYMQPGGYTVTTTTTYPVPCTAPYPYSPPAMGTYTTCAADGSSCATYPWPYPAPYSYQYPVATTWTAY
mmetsp:Transcript_35481/g.80060  ORF Transcript_35481/g.80060 Transcript_35481/m.80060 type:complete len:87 (-) Transcript_35481:296-556(-)